MALAPGIDLPGRARAVRSSSTSEVAETLCPLERFAGPRVIMLHRKTRHSLACRMGHVAISRSGVFAVGVAPTPGEPIATQVVGGMLSPARTELLAGGRVVNELVDAVVEDARDIGAALDEAGHENIVVTQLLWLPGSRMPLLRRPSVGQVTVVTESRLRRALSRRGSIEPLARDRLERVLTSSIPGFH